MSVWIYRQWPEQSKDQIFKALVPNDVEGDASFGHKVHHCLVKIHLFCLCHLLGAEIKFHLFQRFGLRWILGACRSLDSPQLLVPFPLPKQVLFQHLRVCSQVLLKSRSCSSNTRHKFLAMIACCLLPLLFVIIPQKAAHPLRSMIMCRIRFSEQVGTDQTRKWKSRNKTFTLNIMKMKN